MNGLPITTCLREAFQSQSRSNPPPPKTHSPSSTPPRDRKAEGHRSHAREFSDKGGAGYGVRDGRRQRHADLLVHGHRLDDGAVADLRCVINGATICIYDGAPDYPTADRMWEFYAKHKVEVLGISPTLVRALAAHEVGRNADASVRSSKNSVPPSVTKANRKKGWHTRGYLPHFDGNAAQSSHSGFADSLPQSVSRKIEREIEEEKSPDAARAMRIKVEENISIAASANALYASRTSPPSYRTLS